MSFFKQNHFVDSSEIIYANGKKLRIFKFHCCYNRHCKTNLHEL